MHTRELAKIEKAQWLVCRKKHCKKKKIDVKELGK